MKSFIKSALFILTFAGLVVSCSHQQPQDRKIAAKECWDSVKGEYNSYFDSVEKCIEKQSEQ